MTLIAVVYLANHSRNTLNKLIPTNSIKQQLVDLTNNNSWPKPCFTLQGRFVFIQH